VRLARWGIFNPMGPTTCILVAAPVFERDLAILLYSMINPFKGGVADGSDRLGELLLERVGRHAHARQPRLGRSVVQPLEPAHLQDAPAPELLDRALDVHEGADRRGVVEVLEHRPADRRAALIHQLGAPVRLPCPGDLALRLGQQEIPDNHITGDERGQLDAA